MLPARQPVIPCAPPRVPLSQLEAEEEARKKKTKAEQEAAVKRKADQQEKAQIAVQREALAKAAKRGHGEAWAAVAAKQGEVGAPALPIAHRATLTMHTHTLTTSMIRAMAGDHRHAQGCDR